jgi:NitT/TauT family transport system substrate-binding protein
VKLFRTASAVLSAGVLLLGVAACGSSSDDKASGETPAPSSSTPAATATTLRLGYFANVTHATALYGVASGEFQKDLGATKLETSVFNAGPAAIEALRGGALDAAFLGPNPAVNGFTQTDGKLLRIIAGTTYGGASLVVKPDITDVAQLKGKKIATPQLGNTQDVAAKKYFKDKGVDVTYINQENAQSLETFKAGSIDGAWVPEPWASRLVIDGGGKVLIDEAALWPEGKFVTTHLVVSQEFLNKYPGTVNDLLKGLIASNDAVATKSDAVQKTVNDQITKDTSKGLSAAALAASFKNFTPSLDPVASSLQKGAENATAVGVTKSNPSLKGIYDLRPLNALLKAAGKPALTDNGLGVDGS